MTAHEELERRQAYEVHNGAMSMRTLLSMGAIFMTACAAHGGTRLEEPVGQTSARGAPPPSEAASVTPSGASNDREPDDREPNVAGASGEPCRADPPIVKFDGASTEIDQPQVEALRSFAGCLNGAGYEKTSVVLIGYTDVIGTVSANLELGLGRAQAVMNHLVAGGVAPGRIVVASAGELVRPQARLGLHAPRVEILITRAGPPRPNEAPIARGIDAAGLMHQPQTTPPPRATPPARPSNAQPTRKR
jgi:outer membrane protein OmpA-like peptidoglycan-associated protein